MSEADPNTTLLLGELRGQMRELIHGANNRAMENAVIVKALAKLEELPADIKDIKERLAALEADKNRREGALGLGGWLMRSNLVVYIIMAAAAVVAYAKGLFAS